MRRYDLHQEVAVYTYQTVLGTVLICKLLGATGPLVGGAYARGSSNAAMASAMHRCPSWGPDSGLTRTKALGVRDAEARAAQCAIELCERNGGS